jgi:hypothetical protein
MSVPTPPVRCSTARTTSTSPLPSTVSAPNRRASASRSGTRSIPMTRHPEARANCTVSSPMRPSPYTTTVSPRVGAANRSPWRPMAARGVKAATSNGTPSGILAASVQGTRTTSAWGPLVTTRSPGAKPRAAGPASRTTPAWQ